MSSLRAKQTVHSAKFAEKRRKEFIVVFFLCTLCLLSVLAAFILLIRSAPLQIRNVEVAGNNFTPKDEISNAVQKALTDGVGRLIPDTSILFFSKSKITAAIATQFPDVKNFSVSRSGFSEITISLNERTPAAIVCAGFRDVEAGDTDCFWTDEHGLVFTSLASSSMSFKDQAFNHYYLPGGVEIGKNFVEESRFKELETFVGGARRAGLDPRGVLIGENGQYEMYIKNIKGDSEATVYFDDRSSFDSTLSNLLTFWNNALSTKKDRAFDYINLRFGNTVYYSRE
jgi:hypothetical protein